MFKIYACRERLCHLQNSLCCWSFKQPPNSNFKANFSLTLEIITILVYFTICPIYEDMQN